MTLQEHYLLLQEGKGHKDSFMKSARRLFPEYISTFTPYNEAVNILKNKSILSENISGIAIGKQQDWISIFKENMVNEAKKKKDTNEPSKEVKDLQKQAYDEKDTKNIDNLYGQEFLVGYYAEMKDPKNEKKTVEELKSIVAKNLAKDSNFYVKDGQFGVKGLGYSVDHPGLGESKPVTGKYKSSGYGNLNEGLEKNELMAAKDRAKRNSEEGYVQHVNKTESGYEVSDWYDSDTTVCSYEDGREINNREDMFGDEEYANDLDNYDDEMYNQSYQWDDENPDLRDLGADPKLYESKLRSVISQLIKEELDMTEIESYGEDAKKKAMNKKIDEELTKHKRKLKALTTLTELEEDTVNPLKLKELQANIKKLEAYKKKMNKVKGGKKKAAKQEEEITDAVDPKLKDIEKKKEELEKQEASVLNKPGVQSA